MNHFIETTRSSVAAATPREHGTAHTWESLAFAAGFRISELARICHVSVRTLQRHFRKQYNLTLSEWLRAVRLEQARAKLITADCIKAVAFDLGYKQASHFTRDFKQRFGVPPSIWQAAAGGGRKMLGNMAEAPRRF